MSSYNNCPFNYYLNYVVGIPSEANKKADRGTATHWVLETIANAARRGNASSWRYDPELLLRIFFRRFGEKFQFGEEDFAECMNHIRIVQESEYWPAHLTVVETERQFEFEVRRKGFKTDEGKPLKLRGTIDLVTEYTCPKRGRILRVVDWKTGKRLDWKTGEVKDLAALYKDTQLRLYHLISTHIYPGYDAYELVIFFIMDGGPFALIFEKDDIKKTLDHIRRIFDTIKSDRSYQRIKDDKSRNSEIWKCLHVCQFGKIERSYISEDGDVLTDVFKYNKRGDYPDVLTDGTKEFVYLDKSDISLCDKYNRILRSHGEALGTTIIQNITIDGRAVEASARNNYEVEGIFKGVIK